MTGAAQRYNALGRYEDALAAAERAAEGPRGLGPSIWELAELVEAAVRSGQAQRATDPLAQLGEIAHAADTDWALGTHARTAATLAQGATAERLYKEAIERLSRIHMRGSQPLARAHLLYGEWLRREHRRVDAREQLRIAHAMLADMGAEGYAERARCELQATGETIVRRRAPVVGPERGQRLQGLRRSGGGDRRDCGPSGAIPFGVCAKAFADENKSSLTSTRRGFESPIGRVVARRASRAYRACMDRSRQA